MKYIFHVAILALLASLASCVSSPPNYMPPPSLTSQTGATIVGSRIIDPSRFTPNTKATLSAVDNQPTQLGGDDWETTTLVAPGSHVLTVFICKCSPLSGFDIVGTVTLLATVKSGGTYTIHTTIPTGFNGYDRHFVTVWIEDGTGFSITPKTTFEIDGSNPPIVQLFEH